MKYLSIDIETTGLNYEKHQILSFACIIEDTENNLSFENIPKLYLEFKDEIKEGADFKALAMNSEVLNNIADNGGFYSNELGNLLHKFLIDNNINVNESLNLAGKNLSEFDLKFLSKISWLTYHEGHAEDKLIYLKTMKYSRRIIDVAILYADWGKDKHLPNLSLCKERAGLETNVSHNALDDAWDVIRLLRLNY